MAARAAVVSAESSASSAFVPGAACAGVGSWSAAEAKIGAYAKSVSAVAAAVGIGASGHEMADRCGRLAATPATAWMAVVTAVVSAASSVTGSRAKSVFAGSGTWSAVLVSAAGRATVVADALDRRYSGGTMFGKSSNSLKRLLGGRRPSALAAAATAGTEASGRVRRSAHHWM